MRGSVIQFTPKGSDERGLTPGHRPGVSRSGLVQALILATVLGVSAAHAQVANRAVYLDNQGVIRWTSDKQEVTLFGANYVITTASDYRAAGYVHADRKKLIDEDMAQFAPCTSGCADWAPARRSTSL